MITKMLMRVRRGVAWRRWAVLFSVTSIGMWSLTSSTWLTKPTECRVKQRQKNVTENFETQITKSHTNNWVHFCCQLSWYSPVYAIPSLNTTPLTQQSEIQYDWKDCEPAARPLKLWASEIPWLFSELFSVVLVHSVQIRTSHCHKCYYNF